MLHVAAPSAIPAYLTLHWNAYAHSRRPAACQRRRRGGLDYSQLVSTRPDRSLRESPAGLCGRADQAEARQRASAPNTDRVIGQTTTLRVAGHQPCAARTTTLRFPGHQLCAQQNAMPPTTQASVDGTHPARRCPPPRTTICRRPNIKLSFARTSLSFNTCPRNLLPHRTTRRVVWNSQSYSQPCPESARFTRNGHAAATPSAPCPVRMNLARGRCADL